MNLKSIRKEYHNPDPITQLVCKANETHLLIDDVECLSYIVSKDGIETDPKKIQAIVNWPRPTNVTDIHSFYRIYLSLQKVYT